MKLREGSFLHRQWRKVLDSRRRQVRFVISALMGVIGMILSVTDPNASNVLVRVVTAPLVFVFVFVVWWYFVVIFVWFGALVLALFVGSRLPD